MLKRGRPVLVGTRSVEASEILGRLFQDRGVDCTILNARQNADEAEIVAQAGQTARITVATNMAGRGTDITLSEDVRRRGGLHVILTELHESARIDRQLYGRAGRQGDPGSCEAIIAHDDELFRRFASPLTFIAAFIPSWRSRLPARWGSIMKATAQARAGFRSSRQRARTLLHGDKFDRSLGFAGRPD